MALFWRHRDEPVEPQRVVDEAVRPAGFTMVVEDVFTIRGRGTVATGRIGQGTVGTGQSVRVMRSGAESGRFDVAGVEMFHKIVDRAGPGDHVGLFLRGATDSDLRTGDEIT